MTNETYMREKVAALFKEGETHTRVYTTDALLIAEWVLILLDENAKLRKQLEEK